MTHGNYAQTRFHLSDRINRETVGNLKLSWSFEMDVTESIQTAPIVYDGIMYVTSSFNHLFALDAKTGRELWPVPWQRPKSTFTITPSYNGRRTFYLAL